MVVNDSVNLPFSQPWTSVMNSPLSWLRRDSGLHEGHHVCAVLRLAILLVCGGQSGSLQGPVALAEEKHHRIALSHAGEAGALWAT